MKTKSSKFVTQSLAAMALALLGSSSFAAPDWTKSLNVDCSSNAQSQACSNLPAATITAWTTGNGSKTTPTVGNTFASSAIVYNWSTAGLGIVSDNEDSRAQGPHAIDNGFGIEAMMVNFTGGPVNLSSLTLGWNGTDNACISANSGTGGCSSTVGTSGYKVNYNDSDLSVLAWTGVPGGPAAPTMAGSGLLSAGWTLVGNYADVGAGANNSSTGVKGTAAISTAIYSSYWLISAYSSSYHTAANPNEAAAGTFAGLNQGNDSFKVLSIAGNYQPPGNKVPEPGSIALLGLGLVGMVAARRRKQASM